MAGKAQPIVPPPPSTIANPHLFQGARYDAETGFYYLRNRHYDPRHGRFLQRDPVWDPNHVGGWHTFVNNSPVSRRDPLGLDDPRLHYAEELDVAKRKAQTGCPRLIERVHRLQWLLGLKTDWAPAEPKMSWMDRLQLDRRRIWSLIHRARRETALVNAKMAREQLEDAREEREFQRGKLAEVKRRLKAECPPSSPSKARPTKRRPWTQEMDEEFEMEHGYSRYTPPLDDTYNLNAELLLKHWFGIPLEPGQLRSDEARQLRWDLMQKDRSEPATQAASTPPNPPPSSTPNPKPTPESD